MSTQPIVLGITLGKPGGTTTFVWRFARWLQHRGENVVVLIGEEGTWLRERCIESKISFRVIPHLQREIHPWHDALALKSFYTALRDLQPRVLHLNSAKAGVIGSLAGRLARVPNIVYFIGGWAALSTSSPIQRAAYLWPERLTGRCKDTIICLHPGDAAFANKHGIHPKKSLIVIPNGINETALQASLFSREEARRKLSLPQEGWIFGTVANFYPPKDLPRYMRACRRVVDRFPNAHFCLIGDGMERGLIEEAIRTLHLELSVHLAGSREEASRFLRAFDAFVLPSKKEGMPFVLLEAAAAGLPIIATDVGAHRWMLPEATIVPPQNEETLAEALCQEMQMPHTPDYKTSLARFDEEACFEAHFAALTESLPASSPSAL